MVSPEVMYGCESWTMKKAERRRIDAFVHSGVDKPGMNRVFFIYIPGLAPVVQWF